MNYNPDISNPLSSEPLQLIVHVNVVLNLGKERIALRLLFVNTMIIYILPFELRSIDAILDPSIEAHSKQNPRYTSEPLKLALTNHYCIIVVALV